MNNPVLYILSCQHVMPGTEQAIMVHCHQCNKIQPVKDVHVYENKAQCADCTFARFTGLSRGLAELMANQHVAARPGHQAGITYLPRPASVSRRNKLLGMGVIKEW